MTAAREAAGRVDALRMRVARRRRACALVHIYNRHHTHTYGQRNTRSE